MIQDDRGFATRGRERTRARLPPLAAIQRFPEVVEPLRDGRLCISSIVELARVITPENRADVLPRFFHTSKQEAKAVAVEIRPQEAVPKREVVTAVAPACARPLPPDAKPSPVRQDVAEVLPV